MDKPVAQTVIDITDLVEKTRSAFVDWAVEFVYVEAVALMPWLATPFISTIVKAIIKGVINVLSKAAVMQAFFFNTAVRKAAQAADFVEAATALENIPKDATDEVYKKAEVARAAAFRNFVLITN